jgi:uncharacterized membrane protein
MEELIKQLAEHVALSIEVVAILVVAIGTLEVMAAVGRALFGARSDTARREAWLKYMHWLAAGLTFQLAGDIVHSAIAPTWEDVGRLAAIAAIRTFLNYFLDRDMEGLRKRLEEASSTERA